jgi:hypothetical protein
MRQFWEIRSYTHLSLGPYSQNDPVRGPYQCWPGMSRLVRLSTRAYTWVWVALTDGQFDVKRTDDTLPRQACVLQSLQNAPMGWASHDANLCIRF